ncbi:hypothetical protein MUK42_34347 [Musa troglodytarum]|uniref:Uncharacterized protein n=1 Tax=Musa troglodytarum TaxID=320322 RepID=A0A9E7GI65_9LILI|nr:hypothetical protein MUK42_34347 [Musa troglodytarum]
MRPPNSITGSNMSSACSPPPCMHESQRIKRRLLVMSHEAAHSRCNISRCDRQGIWKIAVGSESFYVSCVC